MNEQQIHKIVKETVSETLTRLGFTPDDPQKMQKRWIFLDELYESKKHTKKDIKSGFIRWAIPPFAIAAWETIKNFLNKIQ